MVGHVLGGWAFSGAYVYGSGQPFTPRPRQRFWWSQFKTLANGNYFDTNYVNAFVGDAARPFYGNVMLRQALSVSSAEISFRCLDSLRATAICASFGAETTNC